MIATTPGDFTLGEARGVDNLLRAQLPDFSLVLPQERSKPVVVGKWYCPFRFIKEGTKKDQIKRTVFYEMTLEQTWERIFRSENSYGQGKSVTMDVMVLTQAVKIAGKEAILVEKSDDKGLVWFRTMHGNGIDEEVGLSLLIGERMMWEQEKGGWIKGKEKQVRVVKEYEEYGGRVTGWISFDCYMLVESFVLKRNEWSLVLTYEFNHTHHLKTKWD